MNFVQSHKAPPTGSPSSQSSREVKNLINGVGAAHQGAERREADQGPAQDVSLAASGIPTAETALRRQGKNADFGAQWNAISVPLLTSLTKQIGWLQTRFL